MKVRPSHERLLVKRIAEEDKTKAGHEHLIIREDDVVAVLE